MICGTSTTKKQSGVKIVRAFACTVPQCNAAIPRPCKFRTVEKDFA